MKVLLSKIIALCSLVLLTCILLHQWVNQKKAYEYTNNYYAAIADKNARLHGLKSPKIILVGGSNVTFGINSERLGKAFKMPVVNLSLNAGLGLPFMLNEAKTGIGKGDIVLLCPEYYLREGTDYTMHYVADLYRPAKQFIPYANAKDRFVKNIKYYVQKVRNALFLEPNQEVFGRLEDTTTIYFRKGFNQQGDLISHLNNKPPLTYGAPIMMLNWGFDWQVEKMNHFAEFASSQRATVWYSYPCLAKTEFERNHDLIRIYQQQLEKHLKIKQIDTPADYMFTDSCFFDTAYHLRANCREERTNKLIKAMNKAVRD